jgi:hypothetical protein
MGISVFSISDLQFAIEQNSERTATADKDGGQRLATKETAGDWR